MLSLARISIQRNVGVIVVVLGMLVGGTWAAVKITTNYLLGLLPIEWVIFRKLGVIAVFNSDAMAEE
jgi:hypothetical protein